MPLYKSIVLLSIDEYKNVHKFDILFEKRNK